MSMEIKLLVQKQKKRVVFAECNSDFVDVLFNFLTLPLGTIVRLLKKQSGLGCIDKLYDSVEKLDIHYLQTAACKNMLLQPRSAAEKHCQDLAVNIDELNPRRKFICSKWNCVNRTPFYFSSVRGIQCSCGSTFERLILSPKSKGGDGIFVKKDVNFIVTDDLSVVVSSISATVALLQKLSSSDTIAFEEIKVRVCKKKVLQLLQRSLISKTPLTDVFLRQLTNVQPIKTGTFCATKIKTEDNKASIKKKEDVDKKCNTIKLKIVESKLDNKILCMESGNEFADLLFSFLTFPLGLAVSLICENNSFTLGSINNLYKSIDDLRKVNEDILIDASKDMLLSPKLHPYFGCYTNKLLKVEEMLSSGGGTMPSCDTCFSGNKAKCIHGLPTVSDIERNPKMKEATSKYGGGYARTSMSFLITNEVMVKPLSAMKTVELLNNQGFSFNNMGERVVNIGPKEALNLLKACLVSSSLLDNFFPL